MLEQEIGEEMRAIGKVAKINQTDHAQGHICPDTPAWLRLGPSGLAQQARRKRAETGDPQRFYEGVEIAMEGAAAFLRRYARLAEALASAPGYDRAEMLEIARICAKLAAEPPETFHEALQSAWMLLVLLQMESNASSFSPGRMDQFCIRTIVGTVGTWRRAAWTRRERWS